MKKKLFLTPEDAESAFYDAFERADLAAMMTVWAIDKDTVCIHPQGPRLAGFDAIRASFAEIFSHGPNLHFDITDLRKHHGQTLAIHCVYETINHRGAGADEKPRPVFSTNVYTLTPQGWRILVHHAAISPEGTNTAEQGTARILHWTLCLKIAWQCLVDALK